MELWSYPNYNPTYKRLAKSPAPPSRFRPNPLNNFEGVKAFGGSTC